MKKILVIDDDPLIAQLVRAALKEANIEYNLDYCSDGGQGKIKAAGGGYDLITLDLAMPFLNGVEALDEIKRNPRSSHSPVIVMTGLHDPVIHERVLSQGAWTVIEKPFDLRQLTDAFRLIFAGSSAQQPTLDPDLGPLDKSG